MTPGLKPSISASAWPSRSSTWATAALSFRSSSTTLRPRTATAFKFLAAPTRSSVMTSAPMSASNMQAKGPGPMPANSTMRKPASGPEARTELCGAGLSSTVALPSSFSFDGNCLALRSHWQARFTYNGCGKMHAARNGLRAAYVASCVEWLSARGRHRALRHHLDQVGAVLGGAVDVVHQVARRYRGAVERAGRPVGL